MYIHRSVFIRSREARKIKPLFKEEAHWFSMIKKKQAH